MIRPLPIAFISQVQTAGRVMVICLLASGLVFAEPTFPWRGPPLRTRVTRPAPLGEIERRPNLPSGIPRTPVRPARPETVRRSIPEGTGVGLLLTVHEKFLDEWLRMESQETGPVRDCILGAQVLGCQQTESRLSVDFIPDATSARMELQLRGVTRNQTQNRTHQAVVHSTGEHHFRLSKAVRFDGHQLFTRSPSAFLTPHQVNRGAMTPASAIPIIGPLSNGIAMSIAEQRRPQSEQVTAQRITQQVAPQFNRSVDERLTELNTQLQAVVPNLLLPLGIQRPEQQVSTTDEAMTVALRWAETREAMAYQDRELPDAPLARMALHVSTLNGWIDQWHLEGRQIPVKSLDAMQNELEDQLQKLTPPVAPQPAELPGRQSSLNVQTVSDEWLDHLGQPTEMGPLAPGFEAEPEPTPAGPVLPPSQLPIPARRPANTLPFEEVPETDSTITRRTPAPDLADGLISSPTMTLADRDPLRIAFINGEAIITLTAAFQVGLTPQTDFHTIRIPLRAELTQSELRLVPGAAEVEPITPSSGPLATLAKEAIRTQFESRLRTLTLPARLSIPREARTPLVLQLNRWEVTGEWLTIEESLIP